MTEQAVVYQVIPADEQPTAEALPSPARRVTPAEGADMLVVYFMRRRDVLIAELREIDRLLGRAQTVPERQR